MPELQRDPVAEYLYAAEVLTRAHEVPMSGPDGRFHGVRLEAPLLQILARDCAAGVGRGNGVGSEAHTRTPVNVGAVDLLDKVRKAVLRDYGDMVGGDARPDVVPALIAVRLPVIGRWRAGTLSTAALDRRTATLLGWAQAIHDLLDPPMRIELTESCPRCGERWVLLHSGDSVAALTTTYRDVREATTTCAHCHASWSGIDASRRLSVEIDANKRMRALLSQVA